MRRHYGSLRTRLFFQRQKAKRKNRQPADDHATREIVNLSDGTAVRVGDTLRDGTCTLGRIVSIHPGFLYLSTTDGVHREVRTASTLFQTLTREY